MSGRNNAERTVTVSGNVLRAFSVAAAALIDTAVLDASIAPNLAVMADMYGLYRFVDLHLELPAGLDGSSTHIQRYGLGFTPEVLLTNPTTLGNTSQLPYFVYHQNGEVGGDTYTFTTDRQHIRVRRGALLRTGVKWFRTLGKGTEPDWETQGTLVFAVTPAPTTTPATCWVLIRYTCEFTDVLPTEVTRERLLTQLSEDQTSGLGIKPPTPSPSGDERRLMMCRGSAASAPLAVRGRKGARRRGAPPV